MRKLWQDFRRALELNREHGKKGFTLVELLIVIAIIAILAAIAIPQFSKYKARAYVAAMMNDAHNIIASEEAYYAANDKYFICGSNNDTANYHYVTCNDTGIFDNSTALVLFSKDVSFDDNGTLTNATCDEGVPGYKFTLKHAKTNKKVSYNSCTDKSPHEE